MFSSLPIWSNYSPVLDSHFMPAPSLRPTCSRVQKSFRLVFTSLILICQAADKLDSPVSETSSSRSLPPPPTLPKPPAPAKPNPSPPSTAIIQAKSSTLPKQSSDSSGPLRSSGDKSSPPAAGGEGQATTAAKAGSGPPCPPRASGKVRENNQNI